MGTIVIVDDEPDVRNLISDILSKQHATTGLASADAAIAYCKDNSVDLIITDLFMPEKTGIDLIETISEINKEIRFLAISGGSHRTKCDFLPVAEIVGAHDTLLKPFTPTDLREKVDTLLG